MLILYKKYHKFFNSYYKRKVLKLYLWKKYNSCLHQEDVNCITGLRPKSRDCPSKRSGHDRFLKEFVRSWMSQFFVDNYILLLSKLSIFLEKLLKTNLKKSMVFSVILHTECIIVYHLFIHISCVSAFSIFFILVLLCSNLKVSIICYFSPFLNCQNNQM